LRVISCANPCTGADSLKWSAPAAPASYRPCVSTCGKWRQLRDGRTLCSAIERNASRKCGGCDWVGLLKEGPQTTSETHQAHFDQQTAEGRVAGRHTQRIPMPAREGGEYLPWITMWRVAKIDLCPDFTACARRGIVVDPIPGVSGQLINYALEFLFSASAHTPH